MVGDKGDIPTENWNSTLLERAGLPIKSVHYGERFEVEFDKFPYQSGWKLAGSLKFLKLAIISGTIDGQKVNGFDKVTNQTVVFWTFFQLMKYLSGRVLDRW